MKKVRSNKTTLKAKSTSLRELPLIKIETVKLTKRVEAQSAKKADDETSEERSLTTFSPKPKIDLTLKLERRSSSLENYEAGSKYQLDKRQRFDIYKRRLTIKPAAKSAQEAIEIINKTLDEIEDKYAPNKENKFYAMNSKKYGRMYPIPKDRIKLNPETGITELLTVGMVIYVRESGSIEMWSVPRGNWKAKKLYMKSGGA